LPLKQILKTVYAPHKAFKEIIQNPKYLGPLLIMVMLVIANVAFTYAATTKTIVEHSVPTGEKLDEWTQNSTLWTSNAAIGESNDSTTGGYFGNAASTGTEPIAVSMAFAITNATQIWTELDNVGPVNCSSPDEYDKLSFRVKWTSPQMQPAGLTIKLFSNSSSDYFSYSPTVDALNLTSNIWNNLTGESAIQLNSADWSNSTPDANWTKITGFRLELTWNEDSNITLLVDGLFFHGPFSSLFENAGSLYLVNYAILGFMQFIVTWVVLSGLVYIITKAFGGKLVWKPLLILIGFALITMFAQALVNAIAYAALPNMRYPFELLVGVKGEAQPIVDSINSQTWVVAYVQRFMQIAVWIWTIALTTLAVRLLAAISWFKSATIAAIAYFVTLLVESFIVG
jgi:hypothetical protein